MKIKKNILVTLFFCLFQYAYSISSVSDSFYLDKGETHQLLQKAFEKLPDSYFVFVMNTGIMECCAGNLKPDYRYIKEQYPHSNIFFVLNEEGGITENTLQRYMTEIFELEYHKDHTIINNELYAQLQGKDLNNGKEFTKILYVHHGKLLHSVISKWKSIQGLYFPHEILDIILANKVKVSTDKYLQSVSNAFLIFGDKLVQFARIDKTVRILNPETGETEHALSVKDFNFTGADIFNKYLAKTKEQVELARLGASEYALEKRSDIQFTNLYIDERNQTIYIMSALSIYTVAEEDYNYWNGDIKETIAKKGDTMVNTNFAVFGCTPDLHKKNLYLLNQIDVSKQIKDTIVFWPLHAFMVKDSFAYVHNEPATPVLKDNKSSSLKTTSRFKIKENTLEFDKLLPIPMVREMMDNILEHYFEWGDSIYTIQYISPDIYSMNKNVPVGRLIGMDKQEKPETYRKTVADSLVKRFFNFEVCATGAVLNGEYYGFIERYQDEIPLLEIKDRQFKTVQVFDLRQLPDRTFNPEKDFSWSNMSNNIALGNDYLYWFVFENKEFYLYKYKIIKKM